MPENPYLPPPEFAPSVPVEPATKVAGVMSRLVAYLVDVIPITIFVGGIFYCFFGFDEALARYLNRQPEDVNARFEFLVQRNRIRDLSFLVYVLYAALLEGSALRGTIGKRLVGLRVTDTDGSPLTMQRSFRRNAAKILSLIPCGLGFLWALWSDRKRAWHDLIAGTLVVKRNRP